MIGNPGEPLQPAPSVLSDWDYERDLEIRVTLSVDHHDLACAIGLEESDCQLSMLLRAGTGAGSLPRRLDVLDSRCLRRGSEAVTLGGLIPSATLSGRLRLELQILLDREPSRPGALAPKIPGSRLWRQYRDILLEDGGDSRFPIELLGFRDAFRGHSHQHAPWYLDWRPGLLDADFSGAIRVYVNSDREELAARFVEGDALTVQAILGDVMSQMISHTLEMSDVEEVLYGCEDGSVGQQVRKWIELAFPGQSLGSARESLEVTPGRFRAAILAAADVRGIA
jgi:hypothetical protein